jgi:RNA polymerase sigma factor (sigma-70 family)
MGHVITDAELVAASRRGERHAYGQLIERHQRAVCAVALGATGNPALSEDLAQDTFVAAWGQLDQLRETSRLRAWLCGIARNLAKKARRQSRREDLVDDLELALGAATPGPATPFEVTSQAQRDRVVWAALAAVPVSYREVLVLFYQEGRSVREVAQALDLREDVVLQRLSRGRRHLADAVSDLVVSALERRPPPQQLVGRVLAALPPLGLGTATAGTGAAGGAGTSTSSASVIATSRSTSSLSAGGTSMLKLSLLAFTLATTAVGGTYLATRGDEAAPAAATSAVAPAQAAAPARGLLASPSIPLPSARAGAVTPPSAAPGPGPGPEAPPCGTCEPPPSDDEERLTAARIAEVGLHAGPTRGAAAAPVTIVVFGDLQCPYCAKVLGTLDQLFDEYPDKLRLVLKQFPLPHHTQASLAAEATVAAGAQGKFWEFHDLALAQQDDLGRDALIALAGQVGLDVARFTRELDAHVHRDAVARDLATADELEVRATPTFFINGQRFTGAQGIDGFRALIDAELTAPR